MKSLTIWLEENSNEIIMLDLSLKRLAQGDLNQNLKFVLAITLKTSSSDLMLVKPKGVWEVKDYVTFQLFVSNYF